MAQAELGSTGGGLRDHRAVLLAQASLQVGERLSQGVCQHALVALHCNGLQDLDLFGIEFNATHGTAALASSTSRHCSCPSTLLATRQRTAPGTSHSVTGPAKRCSASDAKVGISA